MNDTDTDCPNCSGTVAERETPTGRTKQECPDCGLTGIVEHETMVVPKRKFIGHVVPLALEGDVEWFVDDEVKEKISWKDLANPSIYTHVDVTDEYVELGGTLTSSVSERVARATHWHPAEYTNHDVDVLVTVRLHWPDEGEGYAMPETDVVVEQDGDPLAPPEPDIDRHRHNL